MNRAPGIENQRWTVTCQDTDDGTGDMIVPLPNELLRQMRLTTGDTLTVEKQPDGSLTLTPVRSFQK